jgi:hypothetical protein
MENMEKGAPIAPDNVAAYYAARERLNEAMEGQHQSARAYLKPDMFTNIADIVAGYGRIESAATECAIWASCVERAARTLSDMVNDGTTLMAVFEYESARTTYFHALIKRNN